MDAFQNASVTGKLEDRFSFLSDFSLLTESTLLACYVVWERDEYIDTRIRPITIPLAKVCNICTTADVFKKASLVITRYEFYSNYCIT